MEVIGKAESRRHPRCEKIGKAESRRGLVFSCKGGLPHGSAAVKKEAKK